MSRTALKDKLIELVALVFLPSCVRNHDRSDARHAKRQSFKPAHGLINGTSQRSRMALYRLKIDVTNELVSYRLIMFLLVMIFLLLRGIATFLDPLFVCILSYLFHISGDLHAYRPCPTFPAVFPQFSMYSDSHTYTWIYIPTSRRTISQSPYPFLPSLLSLRSFCLLYSTGFTSIVSTLR